MKCTPSTVADNGSRNLAQNAVTLASEVETIYTHIPLFEGWLLRVNTYTCPNAEPNENRQLRASQIQRYVKLSKKT